MFGSSCGKQHWQAGAQTEKLGHRRPVLPRSSAALPEMWRISKPGGLTIFNEKQEKIGEIVEGLHSAQSPGESGPQVNQKHRSFPNSRASRRFWPRTQRLEYRRHLP
jgi:hypothetical protein